MRCRSIGYSGLVHSVHQSDQSFFGNRSGCLCKHATANLRAKLKSPKLSSWEDTCSSPSRPTANNQSAVKARHDPFRLAPFRTRTHALPVFMQVSCFCSVCTNCACSDRQEDHRVYSGSVCSLQPFKEKATVACDPPYACWPAIQTTEARAHNKKREVELRHDKPRDLFAFRRHTCMHFRLFAAIEKGLLQRF